MITTEQAIEHINGLSPVQIKKLTVDRLLGQNNTPAGSGYFDEKPEELIIQLLDNQELPPENRKAVIQGCKTIYSDSFQKLAIESQLDDLEPFKRLCHVVDVSAPKELFNHAFSSLSLIWDNEAIPLDVRSEAVGASMGYSYTKAHTAFWEQFLENPDFAAYGFSVLLQIDPLSPQLESYLIDLWRHQINDKWEIDTAFLMRRAAKIQSKNQQHENTTFIKSILRKINLHIQLRNQVVLNLNKRRWSKKWVDNKIFSHPQNSKQKVKVSLS